MFKRLLAVAAVIGASTVFAVSGASAGQCAGSCIVNQGCVSLGDSGTGCFYWWDVNETNLSDNNYSSCAVVNDNNLSAWNRSAAYNRVSLCVAANFGSGATGAGLSSWTTLASNTGSSPMFRTEAFF